MSQNQIQALTDDGGELFDLGIGKLWLGFVLRSVKRHLLPFLITFLTIGALGSLLALSSPKDFMTQSVLLARNDASINSITILGSSSNPGADTPAETASSTIKSQASLERLVDQLHLVDRVNVGESSLGAAKRKIIESLSKPDPSQVRQDLVNQLRGALSVSTDSGERNKETVNLSVIWQDPAIAKEILDAAGQNYISDRKTLELGVVNKAHDIAASQLKEQTGVVAKLRQQLNFPEYDERPLPETSPLRAALTRLNDLTVRESDTSAQIATTNASFAYRYRITTPAELPKSALSGHMTSILISLAAGAILGAFLTTLLDVLRGKIVEPWQLSRRFGIRNLADLKS